MTDQQRGVIYNRDRARQIVDFRNLRYGNITPTDIDGLMEFHNKCFVLIELKFGSTELPMGQRIAIERLMNSLDKPGVCFVGEHNAPIESDIDAAGCIVRQYYLKGEWLKPRKETTIKQAVDWYLSYHAPECLDDTL